MLLPGRHANTSDYRYGFAGMEQDNEVKGEGNSYDFGARMFDSRVGRWFATDPLERKYPSLSPYNYSSNSPIIFTDYDGGDFGIKINHKTKTIIIVSDIHTIDNKTFAQAQKSVKQWQKLDGSKVGGYTVNFEINVIKSPEVTDKEVIEQLTPKGAPGANVFKRFNEYLKADKLNKEKILNKMRPAMVATRAKQMSDENSVGNYYLGIGLYPRNVKGGVGGHTDGKNVQMFQHEDLGDLGNEADLVAHEYGHLFGLDDKGGKYFSEKGIMKYASFGTNLKAPQLEDLELILEYAKDVLNGSVQPGINSPNVTLIENIGESDGSNPLGLKTDSDEK